MYSLFFGTIGTIINILLYYYIIQGIVEISGACGEKSLQQQGNSVFIRVMVIRIINAFAIPMVLVFGNSATAFTIGLIIVSLIIEITFLVYIRNAYNIMNEKVILTEETYDCEIDKKSILKKLIITLTCAGVISVGGFIYIANSYIFTPFNYPGILQSEFGIEFTRFRKPARMFCAIWGEKYSREFYTIEDESKFNDFTKEFVLEFVNTINNVSLISDQSMGFFSSNMDFDDIAYELYVEADWTVFHINLYKDKTMTVNNKTYSLSEESYNNLESFIKENFTVKTD